MTRKILIMVMNFLKYSGIVAALLAWLVIFLSISINPWFIFTRNAFSDLGGSMARDPWLYNYGLVVVAIFTFLYGIYLVIINEGKIEVVGSSFIMVAAIFLALIGIYHEGTYPHVFVSMWFFIQFDIAVLTYGIGIFMKLRKLGISMILLSIIAPLVAAIIPWPSTATIEAWGISAIDAWVVLSYLSIRAKEK
ncbi:DUF998 domain-containing protein [Acidianus sp. HS-5]|uniref:DUF998 domain-containing protein n=1 Tax=Acidianus sp. HS-5 TaxID=2886040 RepID=UPI001F36BADC|nr:DUF998 domain-containing protein [Acidianus sp. HS-5]BDC19486.1 hypothetical protein HS5_23760 [Acidianus sp. HS-5]